MAPGAWAGGGDQESDVDHISIYTMDISQCILWIYTSSRPLLGPPRFHEICRAKRLTERKASVIAAYIVGYHGHRKVLSASSNEARLTEHHGTRTGASSEARRGGPDPY